MLALQGARRLRSYWHNTTHVDSTDIHKMSADQEYETFPLEIWLRILDYSTMGVHRNMSKISSTFREVVRPRTYDTLVMTGEGGSLGATQDDPALDDATWVRNLELFAKQHSGQAEWKKYVRKVYLQWEADLVGTMFLARRTTRPASERLSTLTARQEKTTALIREIGSMFSKDAYLCGNLAFYHTMLSWQAVDPFCGITSMAIPMIDQDETHDWRALIAIFRIPTLRYLQITDWEETGNQIEDEYRDPGISNVTHLKLTRCGPFYVEMIPLLQWPKDLQYLSNTSCMPSYDDEDPELGDFGDVSIQETIDTLRTLKDTLTELDMDPSDVRNWVYPMEQYQTTAFSSFKKLRRLKAPLDMFADATGSLGRSPTHTFHTNFPSSLEELTLHHQCPAPMNIELERADLEDRIRANGTIQLDGRWVNIGDLTCATRWRDMDHDEQSHTMFAELCQLADNRLAHPALSKIHLLKTAYQWLNCEHVEQHVQTLRLSGITVIEHPMAESRRSLIGRVLANERIHTEPEDAVDPHDPLAQDIWNHMRANMSPETRARMDAEFDLGPESDEQSLGDSDVDEEADESDDTSEQNDDDDGNVDNGMDD